MQTFAFNLGARFRCLLGTNPLVRTSDRVQATAELLIAALALLTVAIAAAVATAVHDDAAHELAAQRLVRQQIFATVSADSQDTSQPFAESSVTEIRWEFGGKAHTDTIRTERLRAGDRLTVWVDAEGERTLAVPSDADAAILAIVTALAVWTAVLTPAAVLLLWLRNSLNRARSTAWDRELDGLADGGGRKDNSP
ncbi:Rv1733c family protein [Mycolicibacterium diernhoferi]|uniref:Transmembrane protein n=1 Tax=Mycolicibacterium diernhoferi TaxID=1801 RepID=A0A1Q4HEQ6_9MYCO|nr:hypothetical protein [Mycolicibacterium diernhoferi]OJZ66003.1 hypothetical protein BRW64_11380 [Mycolicibacterium diernhoferi]OPE55029.1 hypothetical protein BV510_07300 [Mycolicibacterium diernhoferi]PEG54634.1 hypothetical protein CRI78_10660 [Mycolicibacterium diernhoferi]QYL23909.1 hypothetical protein K0O62_06330 [Mycolicibacterium diernhoferi]